MGCGGTPPFEFHQVGKPSVSCDLRKPLNRVLNFIQCDAHNLPFMEDSFGLVTLFEVLEHVDSPMQVLREAKRVGRRLVLSTPNAVYLPRTLISIISKAQQAKPHGDHIQLWGKAELENLLNRVQCKSFRITFGTMIRGRLRLLTRLILALTPFPALKYRNLVADVTW